MAMRASEMLMIVRAQNQASGALRRVARDVGSLNNIKGMKMRGQQMQLQQQRLRQQRQLNQSELESLTTGRRAIAQEKALASAKLQSQRAELAKSGVSQAQLRLQEAQLKNAVTLSRLEARTNAKGFNKLSALTKTNLQKQLEAARIAAQRLGNEEARLAEKMGVATGAITKQELHLKELSAREIQAAQRAAYLRGNIANLSSAIGIQAQKIHEHGRAMRAARWDKLNAVGSAFQHFGRVVQYGAMGMAFGLGVAAHSAADFNTQASLAGTQVANTFQQTGRATKQIENGILKLMGAGKAFADSTQQNAAAYDIFSSLTLKGSQANQIQQGMKLLEQFNKAAIAGQVPLEDVTRAGITILNNFAEQGKEVQQLPQLFQRAFAAVRFGRMTMSEFVGSLNQVAPAFSTAFGRTPQAFDQLAAAMGTLTRQMPSVRMAATGLARLSEIFQNKDFIAGMEKSGEKITDATGHLIPFNEVIGKILHRFPELAKGGTKLANFIKDITAIGSGKAGMSGTIQARRALQELILNNKQYQNLSRSIIGDNNEFTKSFRAMADTSGVKWKLFVNQLRAFAIAIGQEVIPVILELSGPIKDALHWWQSLDQSTRKTIARFVTFGTVFAGLGAVVLYVGGILIRLFAKVSIGIGAFGSLLVTIGLVVAAIQLLSGNWHTLNDIVNTFINFGTGSLTGWVTMLTLAAVAALKFSKALRTIAISEAVVGAGGAAGAGGMFGGLFRGSKNAGSTMRMVGQDVKAATGGMAKFRSLGAGLAASVALIPGPLWIAGAAIAAAAGGALLWKHHMDDVKKRSDEVAAVMERNQKFFAAPLKSATRVGGMAGDLEDIVRAKANLEELVKGQKQAEKDFKAHRITANQLAVANIDVARGQDAVNQAVARGNQSFKAVETTLRQYGQRERDLADKRALLASMVAEKNQLEELKARYKGTRAEGMEPYGKQIKDLNANIALMVNKTLPAAKAALTGQGGALVKLGANIRKVVISLSSAKLIPELKPGDLNVIQQTIIRMGRMLTQKELKLIINAQLNPKAASQLSASLRKAYEAAKTSVGKQAAAKSVVTITPKIKKIAPNKLLDPKNFPALSVFVKPKAASPKPAHKQISDFFAKNPPKTTVKVSGPPPAVLASIANNISSGIQGNLHVIRQQVKAFYDTYITTHKKEIEAKSPSRRFAREVGIPIGQGIAVGIPEGVLTKRSEITKTVGIVISLFNGAWLTARQSAIDAGDKITKAKLASLTTSVLRAQKSLRAAQVALGKKGGDSVGETQRLTIAKRALATAEEKLAAAKKAQAMGKPLTAADLVKDAQGSAKAMAEFNMVIAKISKRKGVGKDLIDFFREAGIENLKLLKIVAGMSPKEFAKYIAALKRMVKEQKKSTYESREDYKAWAKSNDDAFKEFAKSGGQALYDLWTNLRQINENIMGTLFQGLEAKVGDAFKSAHDDWASNVADLQGQLADLQSQLANAIADKANAISDAVDAAVQEMQAAFGTLFSGEWMTGPQMQSARDFGIKPTFDDLFKDLKMQTDRFNRWRSDLAALAKKVPPDLAKQLEDLGPDAIEQLEALNGATDSQLQSYIALWQQGQKKIKDVAKAKVTMEFDTSSFDTAIADILKQIDDVTAKLAALQEPHPLSAEDILKNQQLQIDNFNKFQALIQSLIDKGLPADLIQQLATMGPEALPYLMALNSMTAEQLGTATSTAGDGTFIGNWLLMHQTIDNATAKLMQQQIEDWKKHGVDIARALIDGVSSQQKALVDYFTNLFINLLQGKTPTITPPTGGGTGSSSSAGGPPRPPDVSDAANNYSGKSKQSGGDTVHMTVNAMESQSLQSTLSKATFRLKNRKPK